MLLSLNRILTESEHILFGVRSFVHIVGILIDFHSLLVIDADLDVGRLVALSREVEMVRLCELRTAMVLGFRRGDMSCVDQPIFYTAKTFF